jgi:MFS family permease
MRVRSWANRTVISIVLATFFSDFSHEMATAVLPLYLATVGLGPAALGIIEGLADFLVSLSKLGGGVVGHRVVHKRPWATAGYVVTTLATGAMGLVTSLAALVGLRATAWVGRGFRGPLRDHLLADAVEPTHYGRAYGLERAGDMLGAVVGPLAATLLGWLGIEFHNVPDPYCTQRAGGFGIDPDVTVALELKLVPHGCLLARHARQHRPRGAFAAG